IPAGAIYGTISEEDGSPARGVMISLVEVERAPKRSGSLDVDIKNSASSADRTERFAATPLPLGGTYMIVAHRSGHYVTSKPFKVTRAAPLHHTKLVLRTGIAIQGRLIHDDGTPAVGLRYSMSFSPNAGSHSFGTSDQFTDRLGRFTFRNVNEKVDGKYFVNIRENPRYQKQRIALDLRTTKLDVPVELGRIVTGTVVDAVTGWPIPGCRIYALHRPYSTERSGFIDADSKTDHKGNFHFTTMDDGEYLINVSGGKMVGGDGVTVRGGQKEHVRLAVKLYDWSKLKPIDPNVKQP
ncbi:MAG: carboxypeptidase-like regulatory domain-containing protein, partial [Limisphaerales bacterium]